MLVAKNVTLEFIGLLPFFEGKISIWKKKMINSTIESIILIFVSILKVSARRTKPLYCS